MEQNSIVNQPKKEQESEGHYLYDFFLAYSSPDRGTAQTLYNSLDPPAKVFLDVFNLLPGDNFDVALPKALHSSLITVILISPNSENAYYEKEEIAIAIERTRADPHTHRVVPIYINSEQILPEKIPYGLKRKHSLFVSDKNEFTEVREQLLKTLGKMKFYEIKKEQVVEKQQKAVEKITNYHSNVELLSGFNEVTKFVRPLLYTLFGLLIIMVGVLVACIWLSSDLRNLLIPVSGSLIALLLSAILWLIARSLRYAPIIAQGNINGG